jgi:hypothetical protein
MMTITAPCSMHRIDSDPSIPISSEDRSLLHRLSLKIYYIHIMEVMDPDIDIIDIQLRFGKCGIVNKEYRILYIYICYIEEGHENTPYVSLN